MESNWKKDNDKKRAKDKGKILANPVEQRVIYDVVDMSFSIEGVVISVVTMRKMKKIRLEKKYLWKIK